MSKVAEYVDAASAQLARKLSDPLWLAVRSLTARQWSAVSSPAKTVLLEGGNQCLAEGSLIYDPMLDKEIPIEDRREPGHVFAWNGSGIVVAKSGPSFPKGRMQALTIEVNRARRFTASGEHRILASCGWRAVAELRRGDVLFQPQTNEGTCLSAIHDAGEKSIWDLEVPGFGNYLYGGVIHHNSGKSLAACCDALLFALNEHPVRRWKKAPSIWYCTTTYDRFREQPWRHFLNLLLFPDESIYSLPTQRVRSVQWARVGVPKVVELNNGVEIVVKSYDQGPGEFLAKTLSYAVLDEECTDNIYREISARFLASENPRLFVAATPILGVRWLADLREMSKLGAADISHVRLPTLENPMVQAHPEAVHDLRRRFALNQDELNLRLEGQPYHATGLVYPDGVWRTEFQIDPQYLDPGKWTRYMAVDPGWNNCAALWVAVNAAGEHVVYDELLAHHRTIRQVAHSIIEREKGHDGQPDARYIDPAAYGTETESGKRTVDLWRDEDIRCKAAPNNRIWAGIDIVKRLLEDRKLRFFRTLFELQRERRGYTSASAAGGKEKPADEDDHLVSCLRYLCAAKLRHVEAHVSPRPADLIGAALWDQRHPKDQGGNL